MHSTTHLLATKPWLLLVNNSSPGMWHLHKRNQISITNSYDIIFAFISTAVSAQYPPPSSLSSHPLPSHFIYITMKALSPPPAVIHFPSPLFLTLSFILFPFPQVSLHPLGSLPSQILLDLLLLLGPLPHSLLTLLGWGGLQESKELRRSGLGANWYTQFICFFPFAN